MGSACCCRKQIDFVSTKEKPKSQQKIVLNFKPSLKDQHEKKEQMIVKNSMSLEEHGKLEDSAPNISSISGQLQSGQNIQIFDEEVPKPTQEDFDEEYFLNQIQLQKENFSMQKILKEELSIDQFLQMENQRQISIEQIDVLGLQRTRARLPDLVNKFDFTGKEDFNEYSGEIKLLRLIEKPENSTCSYLGQIQGQLCCVKLIPMVKLNLIKKWINRVQEVQKEREEIFFNQYFKKYSFYKIQILDQDQAVCNLFIISALEQYNAYTFRQKLFQLSVDPKITLYEKVDVGDQIIHIYIGVLEKRYSQGFENIIKDVFLNIETIKRNNILISKQKQGSFKVLLADWQFLLKEFQLIIPKHHIQLEDNFMDNVQQVEFQNTDFNLQQGLDQGRIADLQEEQREYNYGLLHSLINDLTKKVLQLIFFKVNTDIFEEVKLVDFINHQKYNEILVEIEAMNIQERLRIAETESEARLQEEETRIADLISSRYELPQIHNIPLLVKIHEMLMISESEVLRERFDDILQQSRQL